MIYWLLEALLEELNKHVHVTHLCCKHALATIVDAKKIFPSPIEQLEELKVKLHLERARRDAVNHLHVLSNIRVV